jgi:hypothetical protein
MFQDPHHRRIRAGTGNSHVLFSDGKGALYVRNNRYTYFAINQTERSVQYCVNDTTAKPDFPGNRTYYCITAKLDVD